jgi:hypothetical protein
MAISCVWITVICHIDVTCSIWYLLQCWIKIQLAYSSRTTSGNPSNLISVGLVWSYIKRQHLICCVIRTPQVVKKSLFLLLRICLLNFCALSVVLNTILDCHIISVVRDITLERILMIQTRNFPTVYTVWPRFIVVWLWNVFDFRLLAYFCPFLSVKSINNTATTKT